MIPTLIVAAALVLHPHSGDITNQPDPIEEVQTERALELQLEELHDLNGPYEWRISAATVVRDKPKPKPRNNGPRLKPGFEAATLRWEPLVRRYFSGNRDVNRALCIISYESGGNPKAKSRSGTMRGLMQHNNRYWPDRSRSAGWGGASIYDPEASIAVGAWLRYNSGWHHWTIRKCR